MLYRTPMVYTKQAPDREAIQIHLNALVVVLADACVPFVPARLSVLDVVLQGGPPAIVQRYLAKNEMPAIQDYLETVACVQIGYLPSTDKRGAEWCFGPLE